MPAAEIVALSRHPRCVAIGEAGLDYHYDNSPRDVQARVFRTHIAAARESGLPLVIHARDADDDMIAIFREEMGQGAFDAVLHCFSSGAAPRRNRRRARLLRLVLGHRHLQALGRAARDRPRRSPRSPARRDRCALPRARAASRPSERAGLCGAHGAGAGRRRRPRIRRVGGADDRQLLPPVRQGRGGGSGRGRDRCGMTLTVTILGCGSSGGVPRVGSGWGACDPQNPKNRRRRCSILVERTGPGGTTSVLVDTSPDLRDQLLDAGVPPPRRGAFHARSCRPHPRHRRPAAARDPHAPPHPGLCRRARRAACCTSASATASRRRPAANTRRSSTSTGSPPARPVSVDGPGGAGHRHAVRDGPRRRRGAWLAASAISRTRAT